MFRQIYVDSHSRCGIRESKHISYTVCTRKELDLLDAQATDLMNNIPGNNYEAVCLYSVVGLTGIPVTTDDKASHITGDIYLPMWLALH